MGSFASEIFEVTSDVFVRSGIGTTYEPLGVVKAGDHITVLDKSNTDWYKVEFEGKEGFISSKYLVIKEGSIPEPLVNQLMRKGNLIHLQEC